MHPNEIKFAALAGLATFALCALLPIACAGAGAGTGEQHVICPASAEAGQVEARTGSTGLSGPVGTLQFRGAEVIFAVGPLRDTAWGELKDPPTTTRGDAVIAKYELPPATDKYVICHYGERFYQAFKLPAATQECDVVYGPGRKAVRGGKASYGISDIVCK